MNDDDLPLEQQFKPGERVWVANRPSRSGPVPAVIVRYEVAFDEQQDAYDGYIVEIGKSDRWGKKTTWVYHQQLSRMTVLDLLSETAE